LAQIYSTGGKRRDSFTAQDIANKERLAEFFSLYGHLLQAEYCRREFAYFIKTMWSELSSEELKWNWHMEYIAEILSRIAHRVADGLPNAGDLIINLPPGSSKSSLVSVMFPVWCWTNWPWMKFIVCSYSGALALEQAELSRDLVKSDTFKTLFPNINIKRDKDTKSNFKIEVKNYDGSTTVGGNRYSTSVGGTLTGFHAHILIVDDPIDPNRAVSEIELNKANRWIDQTLSTRKINKNVTPTIMIAQRLHENDPAGHIMSKENKKYFNICIPGEIRNYRHKVNPPELIQFYRDDLLDPIRMNWDALQNLEIDLGQYGYASQIGQDPIPAGGGLFKVDNFNIVDEVEDKIAITVRAWDKAATAGGGAYTVGVKMAKTINNKFVILDVIRGQWSTDKREQIIKDTAEMDGRRTIIYIEQEPGSGGKDSALATIRNLAGYSVYADKPTGDKVYRADPYSVQVNNGNVFLIRAPWNYAFVEEHRYFPLGKYKDQVDAASLAFSKLTATRRAGPILR